MMSDKIKEKIKLVLSNVHNTYVGKERDRLDRIREELEEQKQVKIVVDAFVNNLDATQSIYVKKTANYFAPIGEQDAIENATIYIIDTSSLKLFSFTHTSKGEYTWTPNRATGDTFKIGTQYVLAVINNKDTFLSASTLNPTAPILDIKIIQEKEHRYPFSCIYF